MARKRILIVEDLPSLAIAFAAHLERAGYEPVIVDTGLDALQALDEAAAGDTGDFAAVLLDLQLPDTDGLVLLRDHPRILARWPVVVATGDASLARAIEAMRLGAFEFLVKPVAGKRLCAVMDSAAESGAGRTPAPAAIPTARVQGAPQSPGGFIGNSPAMREVYAHIASVATSRATVFITGESGTGKEVAAEALHLQSRGARGMIGQGSAAPAPFVAINCGAIPENLLESELFGHLKGSFTGAVTDRIGAAQAAHKGTLFLDEICEMPLALQVKMLRFLQTGTVQKVGSNRVEEVDVRIVCATNRDPLREVAEGRFREDLYYRLAVVPLHLPPLRERTSNSGGDVVPLAQAFLQRFAAEEGKRFDPLDAERLAALAAYPWPGNVRELQNVMRRAAVLYAGPELPMRAFPAVPPGAQQHARPVLAADNGAAMPQPVLSATSRSDVDAGTGAALAQAMRGLTLDEIERIAIEAAVDVHGGSLPAAARVLGVSPSTLYRKRERWLDAVRSA